MDLTNLDMGGKIPRPYQIETVHRCRELIAQGKRSLIICKPTGSGKTTTSCMLIKLATQKGNRTLFLAQRRELIHQTSHHLADCDVVHGVILAQHDDLHLPEAPVQVASKQTLAARALNTLRMPMPWADLLVIDECHGAMAAGNLALIKKLRDKNPKMVLIGLTATPARGDGKGLGSLFDEIIQPVTYEELRNDGFLVPSRVFAMHVPNMKRVKSAEWDQEAAKKVDRANLIGDIYENWKEHAGDRTTVCFAKTIDHSIHIYETFLKHGVKAAHIDQSTPVSEREDILGEFASGAIQVVCNVAVLTEGYDNPRISAVILACPSRSIVKYRQMGGRALRPFSGKQDCVARGTLILTDKGLVSIERITLDHKVWDGVQFVSHSGAVCKGMQTVITHDGLTATPDHKVMTDVGWKAISEAAHEQRRIVDTGIGGTPIRFFDDRIEEDGTKRVQSSRRSEVRAMQESSYGSLSQHAEAPVYESMSALQRSPSCVGSEVALPSVSIMSESLYQFKHSSLRALRSEGYSVQVRESESHGSLDRKEHWNTRRLADRQDRQPGTLRTRQPAMVRSCPEPEQHEKIGRNEQKTIYPIPKEVPTHSLCRQNSLPLYHHWNDRQRDIGAMGVAVEQTEREVWDIHNAGPLQRFTANGKLVHNCVILDHAGAVFTHGMFPDDDMEWTLSKSESIDKELMKKRQAGEAKEPNLCESCHAVFHGPRCPNCGSRQLRPGRAVAVKHGLLKEQKRESSRLPGDATFDDKQQLWHRCLGTMANRGGSAGAAAQMYKSKSGEFPWETVGLMNMPPRKEWKAKVSDLFPQYVRARRGEGTFG